MSQNTTSRYRGSSNLVAELGDAYATIHARKVVDLGNIAGPIPIDLTAADIFVGVLTANVTLSFSNLPSAGLCRDVELRLTQDATGGWAVAWPAGGKWPGGVAHVMATAPNAEDYIGIAALSDGSWTGFPVDGVA